MNKHFKYGILTVLALAITISLAFGQVPIGQTVQPVPFESNPQAYTNSGCAPTGQTMMWDGDLFTSGNIVLGAGFSTTAWGQFATFTSPAVEEWDPEWVEVKIKYEVPSMNDDWWRIEYQVGASAWTPITPDGPNTFSLAIQPFSQLAEPLDGDWSWSDIQQFKLRVYCTRKGLGWDNKRMYIYEVWLTVYPAPLPPISSTTLSVQPGRVTRMRPYDYMLGGVEGICFVEVYVNDVADLFGYQFKLYFDTTVLTPFDAFAYYPWTSVSVQDLNDAEGYVALAYSIPPPVATGEAFYGGSPLARIYFAVDAYTGPTTDLVLSTDPLETILSDPDANRITFTAYDGWVSAARYMSYVGSLFPGGDPTGSRWHEMYPQYCNYYEIVDWTDNGDGDLTASDQVTMLDEAEGTTTDYHVDLVTVTIHFTFKSPDVGAGASEPLEPIWPMGDPSGSYWHMIYPDYCRWFMITSWEDIGAETGVFDPSDQFDFEFLDEPGVTHWAHLDDVTTDIIVSAKTEPGPGPIPEFPFGFGLIMLLAPLIPIAYLWKQRTKVKKQ